MENIIVNGAKNVLIMTTAAVQRKISTCVMDVTVLMQMRNAAIKIDMKSTAHM